MYRAKTDWESTLTAWSQPLGKVEDEKAARAITAIQRAVANSNALGRHTVRTFVQGSYRNNTGVRQESDVDVGVLCPDTFHYNDLPSPHTRLSLGISDASYSYGDFRDDVEDALVTQFGRVAVKSGNKALNVKENTYRVDADVVPCFEYRRYRDSGYGLTYDAGICLTARDGTFITNYPEQQYQNGIKKDEAAYYRFKPMVRAVKKLSCEMEEEGVDAAKPMKSFLIECLVWNLPVPIFLSSNMWERVAEVLKTIEDMATYSSASMLEENAIKPLFGGTSAWTSHQVQRFAYEARRYIGAN
ncbi:nucleotidyltransferase domain-containing protein [Sphingomonas sp. LT1P40]|uniref:nucleotidyltransferase domain-containing protein n=1 Tax=Alteristakelama amylovorans TaxID=3096166 RepID=UPI002FCB877D